MKTQNPLWIDAEEAAELAGLKVETFKRYVRDGVLQVRRSRLTHKSRPRYSRVDIETLLNQNATA